MKKKSKKIKTGFALMTPEQRRMVARMGGKAAHASGNAHVLTKETARIIGRKGGIARARKAKQKGRS